MNYKVDEQADTMLSSLQTRFDEPIGLSQCKKVFGEPHWNDSYEINWCFSDDKGETYCLYDYSRDGLVRGDDFRIGGYNYKLAQKFKGWILCKLGYIDRLTALLKYKTEIKDER